MACMFHDSCGFEDKRVIGYVQIYVFFGEEKGKADVFLLFIPIIISVSLSSFSFPFRSSSIVSFSSLSIAISCLFVIFASSTNHYRL